jgi:hypothetical protein
MIRLLVIKTFISSKKAYKKNTHHKTKPKQKKSKNHIAQQIEMFLYKLNKSSLVTMTQEDAIGS